MSQSTGLFLPFTTGSWRKGNNEVRVVVDMFEGRPVVNLRVYARKGEKLIPTKTGLTLLIKDLPHLENAVVKAKHLAKELGFLPQVKKP